MDKKKVIIFTAVTMAIAWTLQTIGSIYKISNPGQTGTTVFQASLAISMFAPFAATLAARRNLKGIGWKPGFKRNFKWLVFCAYVTVPLTCAGGLLFYLIFPDLFDASGSLLIEKNMEAGVDLVAELGKSGLDIKTYMLIQLVPAVIVTPFINVISAIGEETGWRGFLYPELNKSFGKVKTWIIGGLLWAVFHFPAILIGGYEYGTGYIGCPWFGLIVFTLFCIVFGVMEEIVYDRTKCIWYPALLHGSFNAMATLPQIFVNAGEKDLMDKYAVFGPLGTGLILIVPYIILAVIMGICAVRKSKGVVS